MDWVYENTSKEVENLQNSKHSLESFFDKQILDEFKEVYHKKKS